MARQVVLGKIAATVNGHNTVEITASDGVTLTQDDAVLHLSAPGVAENAREISELIEDNNTNKSDIALNKEAIAANSEAIANMENNKVNIDTFNAHVNDNIKHITAQERDVWNNKADGTEFNNLKSDYQDTKDELSRHEDDTEKHTSYEEREYWNKKIDQDNLIGTDDTTVPKDDWSVYSSDKVDELLQGVDTVINTKIDEIEENITNIMATKQNKIKKSINSYPSVLLTVPGSDAAPDLVYQGALLLGEDISTWMWDNYIDYNDNEKQEPSYKTETGMYLMDVSTIERSFRNVYYTDMLLTSKLSLYMYNHYKNKSITTSSGKTVSKYVTTTDENDPLCLGIYHNVPLTIYNTTYNANVINSWMNEKFNILDFQRTGYGYNVPATPAERQNDSTLTSLLIHGFIRDLVIGQSLSFQSHFGMTKGDDMIAAVYNTYADMDRIVGANSQYENWKSIAAMNGSNKYILVLHDETHDNDATIYQLTANYDLTSHTVTYRRKYSLFIRSILTDIIGITKIADKVIFYNNDDASVLSTLMPTSTSKWPEATVGSKVMTINTYDNNNAGKITGKIYEVTGINTTDGAIIFGAPTNVPSLYELIKDNFINKNIIATSFGDDYGTASDGNKIPNVEAVREFYYNHLVSDEIWDNRIYSKGKIDSFLDEKEDKSNKKSDLTVSGNISDTYYPTTKAVKEYVDYKTEFIKPYGMEIDLDESDPASAIRYIGVNENYSSIQNVGNGAKLKYDYSEDDNGWLCNANTDTDNFHGCTVNTKYYYDESSISKHYTTIRYIAKCKINNNGSHDLNTWYRYLIVDADTPNAIKFEDTDDYILLDGEIKLNDDIFVVNDIDYGDWGDAWFIKDLKVVLMALDGTIKYELDKDNYDIDVDGNPVILGYSSNGNVMVGIPTVWVKPVRIKTSTENKIRYYFSPVRIDDSYQAYAHMAPDGSVLEYKWFSAYNNTRQGTSSEYYRRSVMIDDTYDMSGLIGGDFISDEFDYIRNNNFTDEIIWDLESISDHQLINLLLLLIGKTTNIPSKFGHGNMANLVKPNEWENDMSDLLNNISKPGYSNKHGLFSGDTTTHNKPVKVFGIENWWGNIGRITAGLIFNDSDIFIKLTPGKYDGSNCDSYSINDPSGYIKINHTYDTVLPPKSKNIDRPNYDTYRGYLFPKYDSSNHSTNQYFDDYYNSYRRYDMSYYGYLIAIYGHYVEESNSRPITWNDTAINNWAKDSNPFTLSLSHGHVSFKWNHNAHLVSYSKETIPQHDESEIDPLGA